MITDKAVAAMRMAGPVTVKFTTDPEAPLASCDYVTRTITFSAERLLHFNEQTQGHIMAHELMHLWTWMQGKLG